MSPALALLFLTTSQTLGLPPGLLSALCFTESNHVVRAVNYSDGDSDSLGLCQLKLSTARGLGYQGDAKGLLEAKTNIRYSGYFLAYQLSRYRGDVVAAVSAYNVGQYRVKNGQPVNLTYVRKVLKAWAEHR